MAGNMKFNLTCPRCNGKGRLKNACPTCHGDGRMSHTESVEVRIPAGRAEWLAPARGRQRQCGNHGRASRATSTSPRTWRASAVPARGRQHSSEGSGHRPEAGLGAKIEVPTIDGKTLLKIPPGTQNDQKFRLRERGVFNARKEHARRSDRAGDAQGAGSARRKHQGTAARTGELHPEDPRKANCGRRPDKPMREKSKAAYMISSVAEQYGVHPQTLRLYEREGLLKPSRSDGNTRLYTDEDLERLEVILHLTRDLGVNLAGVEIILNMRARWKRCRADRAVRAKPESRTGASA
jgi:hypothetical protein